MIMDLMKFVTILAWGIAVIASLITAVRAWDIAKIGFHHGQRMSDDQLRASAQQRGFLVPLVIAIICWAFIIAT
jgi:hypothetical protein